MARREYQGGAVPTTITGGITSGSVALALVTTTGWPTGSFSAVLDKGLAGEEKILCTSRSGTTVTIANRGYDGTAPSAHTAGATISPCLTAIDLDEANSLVSGITAGSGIVMAGSTSGSTLLKTTAVAGTTTLTLPAATDTLMGRATADVVTNKDYTSPTNIFPPTPAGTLSGSTLAAGVTASSLTSFGARPVLVSPKVSRTYTSLTAAYTFASGDEGVIFSMNNAASVAFSVPVDATFNFPIGTEFHVFWITGVGQPAINAVTPATTTIASTGATSNTPKLRVANSAATIMKIAANSWVVFGDIV